ncbi:hypothetical protein [Polaromonas sp. LjRoot131]|uniref:hypothetical protein n=1 Tax=Polaromonas sp. LjRoot131 TaxID=3342262 RepID=UPI003ECC81B7
MSFRSSALLAAAAALFLAGCATNKAQSPVSFSPAALKSSNQRVGVAMTALPKAEVHVNGNICLLCIITANAANSTLNKHAATLTLEDFPSLKDKAVAALRQKGVNAIVIEEPLDIKSLQDTSPGTRNAATKDFAPLKQKYGVDSLLVLEVHSVGFVRNYSGYIATNDPKALVRGTGYMVNLTTNTYEWYLPVYVAKSAEGKWDEPTAFPGLTNAYYQALEIGKDNFLRPLAN